MRSSSTAADDTVAPQPATATVVGRQAAVPGWERPALTMLADVPLADDTRDRLGFPAYADALAGLLDHPDTDTPLTIAVNGAWGAGKTSLAQMIQRRLVDRPVRRGDRAHIVCWFNAWWHDDAPHLGAAFAADVARTINRYRPWPRRLLSPLPAAMLSPEDRWRRRILLGLGALAIAVPVALTSEVRAVLHDFLQDTPKLAGVVERLVYCLPASIAAE